MNTTNLNNKLRELEAQEKELQECRFEVIRQIVSINGLEIRRFLDRLEEMTESTKKLIVSTAVEQNWEALRYFMIDDEFYDELRLKSLQKNWRVLQFIHNQTLEHVECAMNQSKEAIQYVTKTSHKAKYLMENNLVPIKPTHTEFCWVCCQKDKKYFVRIEDKSEEYFTCIDCDYPNFTGVSKFDAIYSNETQDLPVPTEVAKYMSENGEVPIKPTHIQTCSECEKKQKYFVKFSTGDASWKYGESDWHFICINCKYPEKFVDGRHFVAQIWYDAIYSNETQNGLASAV